MGIHQFFIDAGVKLYLQPKKQSNSGNTKRLTVISILLLCMYAPLSGNAQNFQVIDSLQKKLASAEEDTNKTKLFYRIWQQYRNNNITLAETYARQGLAHARKLKWNKGIAAFYSSLGEGFDNLRKDDSALFYYNAAIAIYEKTSFKKGLVGALNNLSTFYGNRSNYVKALEYSFKALPIVLDIKDSSYGSLVYNNIGKYYYNQENYQKASEYTLQGLSLAEHAGLASYMGDSYSQLAMIFYARKDTVQSLQYYDKAQVIFNNMQDLVRLAETYSNLSTLKADYRQKLEYALKARNLFDSLHLKAYLTSITNYGNIGSIYFDLVRYKNNIQVTRGDIIPLKDENLIELAEHYLTKSVQLSRETGDAETLSYFLKVLGELESFRQQPAKALAYYKESYAIHDTLFSQENKNRIAALESQRAIEQRDQQLSINKLELSNAKRTRIALMAGAALLFIIGGLLFYQNRIRRNSNTALQTLNNELDSVNTALLSLNHELAEANKIKTQFFGILSHDLRSPAANLVHFLHLQKEAPDLLNEELAQLRKQQLAASAENLLETMESVLLWSKSQMERFVPAKQRVAINDLFEQLRKNIPNNPAITLAFSNPGNISVITDGDYLKSIMYNLTLNAIKALANTPDARLEWKAATNGEEVLISIFDNGPGISPDQMDALYNKEAYVGTKHGLGLHIIRDLAAAIHCRIIADPERKNGTMFTLVFEQKLDSV